MQLEYRGRGSIANLGEGISKLSSSRPFIVTGRHSFNSSGAQEATLILLAKYNPTFFSEFSANPKFEDVKFGYQKFIDSNSDAIIAIGGGSTIDVAKSIAAIHSDPDYKYEIASGTRKPKSENIPPLVAIPTTAGTGSEATHFAVIYINGTKFSITSSELLPKIVILDPNLTDSLPPYTTACSGFDALCQAIESYWSINATPSSLESSKTAILLIMENLPRAVQGEGGTVRERLLEASNLAGKAINVTKTTAPHALSYRITSEFGLAHGHAVAVTLGAFLAYHHQICYNKTSAEKPSTCFQERHSDLCSILGFNASSSLNAQWIQFRNKCRLPVDSVEKRFEDSHIRNRHISSINQERLANHPVRLDRNNLETILRSLSSTY